MQDVTPLSILDADSQKMLAMLTGPGPRKQPLPPKHGCLGELGGALCPNLLGLAHAQNPVSPCHSTPPSSFIRHVPSLGIGLPAHEHAPRHYCLLVLLNPGEHSW